jgi:iron complex outermembrane receptor protein
MPEWKKRSLYFSSMTGLGKNSKPVSRIYYDIFQNTLESFDDESFSTQNRNYAFTSINYDYSLGESLKFTHAFP